MESRNLVEAINNKNLAEVKSLLDVGVNPNAVIEGELSPLHVAVISDQNDIVELLLQKGADVNQKGLKGYQDTPIHYVSSNNFLMKKLLEKHKAIIFSQSLQFLVISPLKEMGYGSPASLDDPNSGADPNLGLCFGLMIFFIQAALINHIETFNKRYDLLFRYYGNTEKLLEDIRAATEKRIKLIEEAKIELIKKANNLAKEEKSKDSNETKEEFIDREINQGLNEEEKILVDLPIFFENVVLSQLSYAYENIFDEEIRTSAMQLRQGEEFIFPLISSVSLEKVGMAQPISQFSGIYTREELEVFFESLKNSMEIPIALSLTNKDHAFAISFDAKEKEWSIFDANNPPAIKCRDEKTLAENVLSTSFCKNTIAFSTKIFTTQKNAQIAGKNLLDWQDRPEIKKMHKVTPSKARLKDDQGVYWQDIAVRTGEEVVSAKKKLLVEELREQAGTVSFIKRHRKKFMAAALASSIVVGFAFLLAVSPLIPIVVGVFGCIMSGYICSKISDIRTVLFASTIREAKKDILQKTNQEPKEQNYSHRVINEKLESSLGLLSADNRNFSNGLDAAQSFTLDIEEEKLNLFPHTLVRKKEKPFANDVAYDQVSSTPRKGRK